MFIQNKHGEVVNTEYILAYKVFDDAKPYQINVFTEKTETIFEFDTVESIKVAVRYLEPKLMRCCLRWAECKNWRFRSDKIMAINDEPCRNLTVSMANKDFHVYLDAKSDDELLEYKNQIKESLSEQFFPDSNITLFETLSDNMLN